MVVDVLYDGLTLQAGAQARDETEGTFIELESPMPVGTRLTVRGPDGERVGQVAHVREGAGAGVLVKFAESGVATSDGGGKKKKSKKAH